MAWNVSDKDLAALVGDMTLDEKVAVVSGSGLWRTAANYRLNIPEILMTDGTYGVRYSIDQIDGPQDSDAQLQMFLSVVNADVSDGVETAFGSTRPATCFPNGSSFACSWDIDLARELGEALAAECQAFGVNLLLGPGINIRRTPLAGRSYEYYSEDPLLTGEIAAAVISGLQENGVGASLKHFACNNSEVQRTTMSSVVDERTLREIYLAGFERAIAKSDPWTVMSSYNRLNDVQAAENHWLLTAVLREEWGYGGLVVSDWHGIKDRPASLRAGNDLDMPESGARRSELREATAAGQVSAATLDLSCRRVLELVRRARNGAKPGATCDFARHHDLSRRMAAESIVLLRNTDGLLPIRPEQAGKIVVVGVAAVTAVIQGSGCATTRPTQVDVPLDEIRRLAGAADVVHHDFAAFAQDGSGDLLAEIETADIVLVFGNTDVGYDGEGSDRTHLHLEAGQDDVIAALAARNPRLAVVLATPDAVEMPWLDRTGAVLATFFAGQGTGRAVAEVLFGVCNPSGKLTVSFPQRLEDVPGFLTYPGENNRHVYSEGLFVGYRYYDARRIAPLFPFGHGLSYTRFAYAGLALDCSEIAEGDVLTVAFDVTNAGAVTGKEVVQVYARPHAPRLHRPVRELKGFAKVSLAPGETRRVSVAIPARDLRYYDPELRQWLLDAGTMSIEVGASSRDIRLDTAVNIRAARRPGSPLTIQSQPYLVLGDSAHRERFLAFVREKLGVDAREAAKVVEFCESSFLGIYNTLSWVGGEKVSKRDLATFLEELNARSGAPASAADQTF